MSNFKTKMHQIRFRLGRSPRLLGELTALPRFLAGFKGPISKGSKGREKRERRERRGKGKGVNRKKGEEKGGKVRLSHSKFLDPPLVGRYWKSPKKRGKRESVEVDNVMRSGDPAKGVFKESRAIPPMRNCYKFYQVFISYYAGILVIYIVYCAISSFNE